MIFNKICHIVYSHTDYCDIWPIYFAQTKKYFDVCPNKIIFLNKKSDLVPKEYLQIIYNDKKTYTKRLIDCFEQVKKLGFEVCFFEHEDMFLYDFPKVDKIKKYALAVEKNYFDFVKLIKGGDYVSHPTIIDETLFELDLNSKWIFSIQPSIWNVKTFLKLLNYHKGEGIWQFEEKSQKTCRKIKIKGAFSHGEGQKVGMHHFSNDVYPYVATAVAKGKWNIKEYPILETILKEYNIDKNIRGEY
ncbi:MAG: hypothetical protein V4612_01865 [Pseudomonadota bacterium]